MFMKMHSFISSIPVEAILRNRRHLSRLRAIDILAILVRPHRLFVAWIDLATVLLELRDSRIRHPVTDVIRLPFLNARSQHPVSDQQRPSRSFPMRGMGEALTLNLKPNPV